MRSIKVLGAIIVIILISCSGYALEMKSYHVSIEKEKDGYTVIEDINLERDNDTNVIIWIQGEATAINIKINGSKAIFSKSGNLYSINLTNLTSCNIEIEYNLPESTEKFMKYILYKCNEFYVKLNGEIIYQGTNLSEGNFVSFSIKEKVVERENYYMYATLILLLALIIVLGYSVKVRKKEEMVSESPELLKVKRDLLMNVLKEIEKKYRAKEISEDVYSRLKEFFKRETVNVVRKLEETKQD